MGPRASLDRCGKSRPHKDSNPGPSSPYPVAMIYDMIYLLTAIGLPPGGSTHLHTNNTQNNTNNNRTTQITTNVEECGPCPVFASFTLAFSLQLRYPAHKLGKYNLLKPPKPL